MLGYKISFNKVELDPVRLQPLLDLPPPTNLKELKRSSGILSYYSKWIQNFFQGGLPSAYNVFSSQWKRLICFWLAQASTSENQLAIHHSLPFSVETDASDYALAAILLYDGTACGLHVAHLNCSRQSENAYFLETVVGRSHVDVEENGRQGRSLWDEVLEPS